MAHGNDPLGAELAGGQHGEQVRPRRLPRRRLSCPGPIGFANSGGLVFMDKSAEEIATLQAIGSVQRSRVSAIGRNEVERAVRSVLVVMATVDAEHVLEMTSAEDEDPVEAVGAERSYPAFGVGVRVRRLDRRADHLDALGAEDLVEGMAELRIAVVDKKPKGLLVAELHDKIARLLSDPAAIGMR